jgi:hypothetical protein
MLRGPAADRAPGYNDATRRTQAKPKQDWRRCDGIGIMRAMPRVSYGCTVYNKEVALPFVLAGLAAQEGDFEREFIFVDDRSKDGNVGVVRRLTSAWDNLNLTLVHFLGEQPGVPPRLARLGFVRTAARAWAWARRRNGKGLASHEFRLMCGAWLGLLPPSPENLWAICAPFAATNSIRLAADQAAILR